MNLLTDEEILLKLEKAKDKEEVYKLFEDKISKQEEKLWKELS